MATMRCRQGMIRRAVTVLAALGAASLGVVALRPAAPAQAAQPAGTGPRSTAQAQAVASGKPVTVPALTTPFSTTTANPDGSFTTDEAAEPVRAWRDGAWAALDPTLHAGPDGTISPAVTTSGLALSGGGSGPLAVMTTGSRSLSLAWPGTLPAPSLAGPTATYPDVLPGVDLVITAGDQGGFSDVLVVKTAAAAANPALSSLKLTVASHGLVLSADAAGDLTAAAGPGGPPLITAQAPRMWDSAALPAGTATVAGPGGTRLAVPSGMPAASSLTGPGAGAHQAAVPVSLSGSTLTLSPPASALSGPGITYPVYIDPTWHNFAGTSASAWTQVDSGFPTTTYWKESSDLQAGYDDWNNNNGLGVARSFVRMPLPSLQENADVHAAELYMDDVWSADGCTATAAQLWQTYGISSSTDWNNQPSWVKELQQKSFAFGSSGCGSYKDDVTWSSSALTSLIQSDIGYGNATQTFGIRAASETSDLQWKQYHNGSSGYIHLSVTYNYPPDQPASPYTSPLAGCSTSSTSPPVVGNDDVTLSAYTSDNDGDNNLTTQFILYNADGTTAWNSASHSQDTITGDNTTAEETALTRPVIQGLHSDGATAAYTYYWQAQTTDLFGLTSAWSAKCWFTYNPAAPGVSVSPLSGPVGTRVAVTFRPPAACSPSTCPASYTYQLGASAPVTVPVTAGSGDWSGYITISQIGPSQLTAYGVSAGGTRGPPASAEVTGEPPSTTYPDGYFTGGSYPDLLFTGPGAEHSLWLAAGSGNGALNPPVDIGSLGTGISPGTDGPGDWAGAIVLHGDFTGNSVQDVMDYYPATGNGIIIAGPGNASPLAPASGKVFLADNLQDPTNGTYPTDLVGAGNASQTSTGPDDLIGISGGDLDLYTGACAACYGWAAVLSTTAPAPQSSWSSYALATAEPGGRNSTVLFALDTATGALYESANPGIGTPGTWTQISVPWGTSPPKLASADINPAGQTELWTLSGTSATAWTLSGTTLSQEAANEPAASTFVPVNPVRILDTRSTSQIGSVTGPVAAGATITVPIEGTTVNGADLPATGITAVAVALTVTGQTGNGNLTAWPAGTPEPGTSTDNYTAGAGNFTDNAVVPVGSAGAIAIANNSGGTVQLIIDVTGYFTTGTAASASTYTPLTGGPVRILDTRNGTGAPAATIPSGGTLTLPIEGNSTVGADVPATGVTAAALTLTAVPTATGQHGDLIVYPDGVTTPEVSELSYTTTTATTVLISAVGTDGKIDIYNQSQDPINLVGDLSGYFTTSAAGQYYHPIDGTRIIDTRNTTALASNSALNIPDPAAAAATNPTLILNITATQEAGSGFLQAYPGTMARSEPSILNFIAGQTAANLALVYTGTNNTFNIYNNSSGTTQVIIDTNGYFS